MKPNILGALCLTLAASIWGGMYVVSKYVLDFVPPFTLMWLRYLIGFSILYLILKFTQKKKQSVNLNKKDWLLLLWIGFIGYFVSIACQFVGTKLSDAHTGALLTSATPAFMQLFARLILKESFTYRKMTSFLLASIGVIIVIGLDENVGANVWGSLILIVAAVTWAVFSIYVKIASEKFSSLQITTYAILFALFFTTPIMIWEVQSARLFLQSPLIILGIIYLGLISTAGAFFLWNKGLELLEASVGSLFFFFQPVVGALLSWLLLQEQLDFTFLIGGIFIVIAILLATYAKQAKNKEQSYATISDDINKLQ